MPFADFVYILQLEEYNSRRFLKWLPRFFLRRNIQVRQRLVFTVRARSILATAIAAWVATTVFMWHVSGMILFIIGVFVWTAIIPIIVLAANVVLQAFFALAHARMRRRATEVIAWHRRGCRTVMVSGSFGKTTVKRFIEQFARYHFRVQMPPGNINTSAGIATWILEEFDPRTTLLIIEADGYSTREYRETCAMIPPDIAIITVIGDQHIERFGSRAALAGALGVVFAYAQPDAHLICDAATRVALPPGVFRSRTMHIVDTHSPLMYEKRPLPKPDISDSNAINLRYALTVAEILAIPAAFVTDTMRSLTLPPRRQQPTQMYGYEALDDSYNISWTTAQAGVAAARTRATRAGKRLLVVTAGIMELGPDDQDKNRLLGALLCRKADHTVVLGSKFADEVLRGFGQDGHFTRMPDLRTFIRDAHEQFPPMQWFLLMQPEMHDLYY